MPAGQAAASVLQLPKDGELWCDHCPVTCYNWGLRITNTWEVGSIRCDQGRLEKVQTMRGAGVDSRKKAMEKTMLKVMSPGASTLLSGHNVDARKKADQMQLCHLLHTEGILRRYPRPSDEETGYP